MPIFVIPLPHHVLPYEGSSRVYRGQLEWEAGGSRDVVCKMILGYQCERLEDEAKFYCTQLKDLQGSTVPRFYGLFTGSYKNMAGKARPLACVMLEPFGSPASTLDAWPMQLRCVLVSSVVNLATNSLLVVLISSKP